MSWSRRKKIPAPTWVLQYRFDAQTGQLSPNTPHRVEQGDLVGPRHYITTRVSTVVYFSNEQGCSVTAYRVDHANCTLSSVQTTSTLAQLALPATSNHRGSGVSLSRIDA